MNTFGKFIISNSLNNLNRRSMSSFQYLKLSSPSPLVVHVELSRPEKRNALSQQLWKEIGTCFDELNENADCNAIVLSGAGKIFCAGIDLKDLMKIGEVTMSEELDVARKAFAIQKSIRAFQDYFTSIEKCRKPVICAMHGACIGGGTSLASATDIRYSTTDCRFSVKEVKMGLAADVGALQRMSKQNGNDSLMRELAFTGRDFGTDEAMRVGMVSRTFTTKSDMLLAAFELAKDIASTSPVAVQGSKVTLNYTRDHSVQEGLDFMVHWNMTMLQSEDMVKSAMAQMSKEKKGASFSKL